MHFPARRLFPASLRCTLVSKQLCSSTAGPELAVALQAHSPHAAWRPPHTVLMMNIPGTQALRRRDSRGFAASPPGAVFPARLGPGGLTCGPI